MCHETTSRREIPRFAPGLKQGEVVVLNDCPPGDEKYRPEPRRGKFGQALDRSPKGQEKSQQENGDAAAERHGGAQEIAEVPGVLIEVAAGQEPESIDPDEDDQNLGENGGGRHEAIIPRREIPREHRKQEQRKLRGEDAAAQVGKRSLQERRVHERGQPLRKRPYHRSSRPDSGAKTWAGGSSTGVIWRSDCGPQSRAGRADPSGWREAGGGKSWVLQAALIGRKRHRRLSGQALAVAEH